MQTTGNWCFAFNLLHQYHSLTMYCYWMVWNDVAALNQKQIFGMLEIWKRVMEQKGECEDNNTQESLEYSWLTMQSMHLNISVLLLMI